MREVAIALGPHQELNSPTTPLPLLSMSIDIDATLDQVVTLKSQIKALEATLDEALDALQQAVDAGDLDPSFNHNDAAFDLRAGRVTYDYPQAVTELSLSLKRAQTDAVADGTATAKQGAPFWVVNLPK